MDISTITGKKGLSFLIFTAFLGIYVLTACSGGIDAQPPSNSTATRPAATATYTPSPTSTPFPIPTPTPVYQEVQGINVPTNVYLEGDSCIPMELAGQEKCVNMFVHGESPTVPNTWKGIVHVIGDLDILSFLTIMPGTEVYVAVGDIADIFGDLWAEHGYALSGINNTDHHVKGVWPGEPFYDDKNHVSIAISENLTAEGTEDQPILITSAAAEPTIWDWNDFDLSGANLSNVTLEYHRNVGIRSKGIINNSVFRHNGGAALWIEEEATVYINNTHFYDSHREGIGGGIPANSVFINNTLEEIGDNVCLVIRQDYTESTRPEISGNTFNCRIGIYIGADTISLNNEQLQSLADYYLPQNNFFGEMTRYRFAVFKDPDDQTPVFSIK